MAEEVADGESSDDVQCALVEYVLGNVQTRKWTLALGQTYNVGRKDSGADIEIDHESLSRRHCSLALTRVESDLVLVVLDKGSTNGTFVDKSRLEKGVGLTKQLADFRFMSFGHCENGYRILTKGSVTNAKGAACVQNKRGGPLSAEQKAQIERLKRMHEADEGGSTKKGMDQKAAESVEKGGSTKAPSNRRERREAARQRSRSRSQEGKPPKKNYFDDQEEWKEKAAKAKQMKEDAKRRDQYRESRMEDAQRRRESGGSSRRKPDVKDKSKSSWRADPEAYGKRKGVLKDNAAEAAEIEWPEEWK
jgi:hypothetical protein